MTDPIAELRARHLPDAREDGEDPRCQGDHDWGMEAPDGLPAYPCLPIRALDAAEPKEDR